MLLERECQRQVCQIKNLALILYTTISTYYCNNEIKCCFIIKVILIMRCMPMHMIWSEQSLN